MKSIILAAGYATRLYPLTEHFPKPLLRVGNRTILDRLVDDLSAGPGGAGMEFAVVTNHRFADIFRDWAAAKPAVRITVLDDGTESNETRLGAVRDIQLAAEQLDIRENTLVMAGDNVLDFSLGGFLRFAAEKGTSCVMCHEERRLEALRKTAVIALDENCRITAYEEKPAEPKGHFAVPPFYVYRAEDLRRIPEALAAGCGADAPGSFAAWLSSRTAMHAWVMPGKRYDIGDLESYQQAQRLFGGDVL